MAKQSYIATSEGQLAVREAIAYHGFTQQQLAVAANLRTRSSISKLINGKPVERQIFQRVCQCLELDFRAIAGLHLSSTSIKQDQLIPSSTPEFSRGLTESVLSELNSLKKDLQALRSVPSVLAVIDAHVQLLRRTLIQRRELSDVQPAQDAKVALSVLGMEVVKSALDQSPRVELDMDTLREEFQSGFHLLLGPSEVDEQIESSSHANELDSDRQGFDRETPELPSGPEPISQEGLNESDNEQPTQVPNTHLLNPANSASFDPEQPRRRDVSTSPSEKQPASTPPGFNVVKKHFQFLWPKDWQILPSSKH